MSRKGVFFLVVLLTGQWKMQAQNLIVNPGAEILPAGSGWTIVNSGGAACAVGTAASTYTNWIMTPDNSVNYPSAHGGLKTFFAGCSSVVPGGPFELYQDINIAADAALIDAGSATYVFSGFIQTCVSPQADAGKFIVDYKNAGGAILGTSYVSANQSFSGGSGSTWNQFINVRTAAIGTRTVRIRLQATIGTGPAVNVYFDDLSFSRTATLPLSLISFKGTEHTDAMNLQWVTGDGSDFSRFEICKSSDAALYETVGTLYSRPGQFSYQFNDKLYEGDWQVYYKLKMFNKDNEFQYSNTIRFSREGLQQFNMSPNPASGRIKLTGLRGDGMIMIIGPGGIKILQIVVKSNFLTLDISYLKKGLYVISYVDAGNIFSKKLLVK